MADRPGFMLYFDRVVFIDRLTDEQNGQIFRAAIKYAKDGREPDFSDTVLWMAWDFLRPALDEDAASYNAKCEKNRQNAAKRWHANACERTPTTDATTTTNPKQPQPQPYRNDLALAEKMLEIRKKAAADG